MPQVPHSPAADRNKQPILELLRTILPARGNALEIASGTGQHVAWFAAGLPAWTWQPTEPDASGVAAIIQRLAHDSLTNVRPPLVLDVTSPHWPSLGPEFTQRFDAIFCANMLHIAPWPCCPGLMQGAARYLTPTGVLVTYGPYLEDETPTAPSNLAFDESLKARNPSWGIRRREDVEAEAARAGLMLRGRHAMPANNLLLVFARTAAK